jgi:hypothetical protein
LPWRSGTHLRIRVSPVSLCIHNADRVCDGKLTGDKVDKLIKASNMQGVRKSLSPGEGFRQRPKLRT